VELFFAPIQPFIWHPERIAVVAAAFFAATVFFLIAKRRFVWWLVVAAASWALFAVWERYCTIQKYDIRVDLMLIAPVLYSITIGGVWGLVAPFFAKRTKSNLPRIGTDETRIL
jgi:hypothetical protein